MFTLKVEFSFIQACFEHSMAHLQSSDGTVLVLNLLQCNVW